MLWLTGLKVGSGPEEAIPIDTPELVEKLEEVVDKSRQLFNTAFVNTEEFYQLTARIRNSLPEDVKSAARITREAEQIISEAKEQAARIIDQSKAEGAEVIEEARAEADRLVDSSEIKRLATEQAKAIIAGAEEEARNVKAGADEYAKEVLSDLESFVDKVLNTIQRGRDKLEHKPAPESPNE